MCFSLAAFGTPLRINDPKCVAKTFPDFFERFADVTKAAPVIAIDGPSASGKGTVAARVAAALGFAYLDSGALYRLTALAAQRAAIDWADEAGVAAIAAALDVEFFEADILLDGVPIGDAIRYGGNLCRCLKGGCPACGSRCLAFRQRAFKQPLVWLATDETWGRLFFRGQNSKYS
jgi:3-phosphoshikimate 1-carboxyvinyltransferase